MEGRKASWGRFRRAPRGRPPLAGRWQPVIPSWEKQFCKEVGSIDWGTLLQKKKFTHLYAKVVQWDDSAGKEAFSNAKNRFWAEINGFPCEIPLPDPNLYIDDINWDSETNPADIECLPSSTADENREPVIIFGDLEGQTRGDLYANAAVAGYSYDQYTSREGGWENEWGWNYGEVAPVPGYRMADGEAQIWDGFAQANAGEGGWSDRFSRSRHQRSAYRGQLPESHRGTYHRYNRGRHMGK